MAVNNHGAPPLRDWGDYGKLWPLEAWVARLEGAMEKGLGSSNAHMRIIYCPDLAAEDLLTRLSATCPALSGELRSAVTGCDSAFLAVSRGEVDALPDMMMTLMTRLRGAIEVVNGLFQRADPAANPIGMPTGRDVSKNVHYGEPPLSWLWDHYPLSRDSWGNVLGFDDGSGDGHTIKMRRWLRANPMSNFLPPAYRPAHAPLVAAVQDGGVRDFYIPTKADNALVSKLIPDLADTGNPPWPHIQARLIVAGQDHEKLVSYNAPTLLALLDNAAKCGRLATDIERTREDADELLAKVPQEPRPEPATLFVSYSHVNSRHRKDFRKHMAPLVRDSTVALWDDTHIPAGDEWRAQIEAGMARASIAVLLVSADFWPVTIAWTLSCPCS